jgi:curved DNA-binding protein CbpA
MRRGMATARLNHYQVLMLDPEVDADMLATVYRRLVQRHRLALVGGTSTTDDIQRIEQAYAILRDPFRRARYDAELADDAVDAPASTATSARAIVPVTPQHAPVAVAPGPSGRGAGTSPTRSSMSVSVLDFGRYAGWSLRQLTAHDPDYLEWLLRAPGGRQYHAEITALLRGR